MTFTPTPANDAPPGYIPGFSPVPQGATPLNAAFFLALQLNLKTYVDSLVVGGISDVPGLSAALALLQASSTAATDSELASAVATLQGSIATKQDASTAATDAELASAVGTLQSSLASKMDGSLGATDVEVEAVRAVLAAADALKIPLSQRGAANGVATLAGDGLLDATQVRGGSGGSGYLGDWTSLATGSTVKANQIVSYQGLLYGRIADGTIAASFTPSNWTLLTTDPFPRSSAGLNLLNVAAATGVQTSAAQTNDTAAVGLDLALSWTVGGNSESLTVELQKQSPSDGTWSTQATWKAYAAATFATVTAAWQAYPTGGESATRRAVTLPAVWRIRVTPSNLSTAETFALGATPNP